MFRVEALLLSSQSHASSSQGIVYCIFFGIMRGCTTRQPNIGRRAMWSLLMISLQLGMLIPSPHNPCRCQLRIRAPPKPWKLRCPGKSRVQAKPCNSRQCRLRPQVSCKSRQCQLRPRAKLNPCKSRRC